MSWSLGTPKKLAYLVVDCVFTQYIQLICLVRLHSLWSHIGSQVHWKHFWLLSTATLVDLIWIVCVVMVSLCSLCRCDGRKVCELSPRDFAQSDPCTGTYKYLQTTYDCIPSSQSHPTDILCLSTYYWLWVKCKTENFIMPIIMISF